MRAGPGLDGVHDVPQLVALGMGAHTSGARAPRAGVTETKHAQRTGPPRWLGPAILGSAIITATVTAYLQLRVDEGARFDVWMSSDGGGLSIQGRF